MNDETTLRGWDGAAYDRLSTPMLAMGLEVLDRLALAGDETVIDAGCGSGRVTEALATRLPRGRAIGVDASPSMIEAARVRLGDDAALHVADLLELDLGLAADAILSTATFHWIADHDRLFARLRAHLREGGALEAQCGGRGNIASVHAAAEAVIATERYAAHFATWVRPWTFAAPAETEGRLRAPASPRRGPGCRRARSRRRTRTPTSPRSTSARTWSASRNRCAPRSSTRSCSGSGRDDHHRLRAAEHHRPRLSDLR